MAAAVHPSECVVELGLWHALAPAGSQQVGNFLTFEDCLGAFKPMSQ
jgi:hypothetical protein